MDIGDASEIPSTRKKLPSLQDLGAFDLDPPPVARRPVVAPPLPGLESAAASPLPPADPLADGVAATIAAVPGARPVPAGEARRPQATREQLRNALAKADPATRSRLLQLIAGGRRVELNGGAADPAGPKPRQLTMRLDAQGRPAASAGPAQQGRAAHRQTPPGEPDRRPRRNTNPPPGQCHRQPSDPAAPLLQIDANTDLLDALARPPSDAERRAAIGAQFAAIRAEQPQPLEPEAPKVLFPSYDPNRHGDDVRRPGRRADGPVEGHFPAPRQPFEARYRHADGRPMNAEENKVEAVLQQQRCEHTLEVLARDGINGLLLSPRDLDAAVDNGTLDAATAALLWQTWAALRPVIHVIDEPAAPADAAIADDEAAAAAPQTTEEDNTVSPAKPGNDTNSPPLPGPAVLDATAATAALVGPALPRAASAARPPVETLLPPVAAPLLSQQPETQAAPAPIAAAPAPAPDAPLSLATRRQRAAALLRQSWRIFVGVCVLSTGTQIALWCWLTWGHLIGR